MKKSYLILVLSVVLIGFQGCKYEDGPAMSCASKKSRVANVWKPDKVFNDGVEQELSVLGNYTLELTKDGLAVFTTLGDPHIPALDGTWTFGDKKETIEITYSSGSLDPDDVPAIYTILRLKQEELWLERNYHPGGDTIYTVETHYIPAE